MSLHLSLTSLLAGALSISAALAWNGAVTAGVRQLYPLPRDSAKAAVVHAIFVTIFVVVVVVVVNHATGAGLVRGGVVTVRREKLAAHCRRASQAARAAAAPSASVRGG